MYCDYARCWLVLQASSPHPRFPNSPLFDVYFPLQQESFSCKKAAATMETPYLRLREDTQAWCNADGCGGLWVGIRILKTPQRYLAGIIRTDIYNRDCAPDSSLVLPSIFSKCASLSLSLSVSLALSTSLFQYVCMYLSISVWLSIYLTARPPACPPVRPFIPASIHVRVCVSFANDWVIDRFIDCHRVS